MDIDPIPAPQRAAVLRAASVGAPPEVIRQLHGCGPSGILLSADEFRQVFARELAHGAAKADAAVAETLHELAISGKSVQATLAWAKQRLGWNDDTSLQEQHAADTAHTSARALAALQQLMDELAARKSGDAAGAPAMAHHGAAQPVSPLRR